MSIMTMKDYLEGVIHQVRSRGINRSGLRVFIRLRGEVNVATIGDNWRLTLENISVQGERAITLRLVSWMHSVDFSETKRSNS